MVIRTYIFAGLLLLLVNPGAHAQDYDVFNDCTVRARSALGIVSEAAAFLCQGTTTVEGPLHCVQTARSRVSWIDAFDPIRLCVAASEAQERVSCFQESRNRRHSTAMGIVGCGGRLTW